MSAHFHVKPKGKVEVKELFKGISKIIKQHFDGKTAQLDVLDMGCAPGELLYFLKNDLRTCGHVYGFDYSKELIDNAYERFGESGIKFFTDDVRTFKMPNRLDIITMTSVLSYFDDPYPILANMLMYLKKRRDSDNFGDFQQFKYRR